MSNLPQIENKFGHPLEWLRLDEKKQSRIQYTFKTDAFNKENFQQSIAWHLEYMTLLEKALKDLLLKAAEALKLKH